MSKPKKAISPPNLNNLRSPLSNKTDRFSGFKRAEAHRPPKSQSSMLSHRSEIISPKKRLMNSGSNLSAKYTVDLAPINVKKRDEKASRKKGNSLVLKPQRLSSRSFASVKSKKKKLNDEVKRTRKSRDQIAALMQLY
jgi:hypothetical protein